MSEILLHNVLMTGVMGTYEYEAVTIARQPMSRSLEGQLSVEGEEQFVCVESAVLKHTFTLLGVSPIEGAAATATAFTLSVS